MQLILFNFQQIIKTMGVIQVPFLPYLNTHDCNDELRYGIYDILFGRGVF